MQRLKHFSLTGIRMENIAARPANAVENRDTDIRIHPDDGCVFSYAMAT